MFGRASRDVVVPLLGARSCASWLHPRRRTADWKFGRSETTRRPLKPTSGMRMCLCQEARAFQAPDTRHASLIGVCPAGSSTCRASPSHAIILPLCSLTSPYQRHKLHILTSPYRFAPIAAACPMTENLPSFLAAVFVALLLLYFVRLNQLLSGTLDDVKSSSTNRWSAQLLHDTYDRLEAAPITTHSYASRIPRALQRRYVVTGGSGECRPVRLPKESDATTAGAWISRSSTRQLLLSLT
jgi:hypothetical protein